MKCNLSFLRVECLRLNLRSRVSVCTCMCSRFLLFCHVDCTGQTEQSNDSSRGGSSVSAAESPRKYTGNILGIYWEKSARLSVCSCVGVSVCVGAIACLFPKMCVVFLSAVLLSGFYCLFRDLFVCFSGSCGTATAAHAVPSLT